MLNRLWRYADKIFRLPSLINAVPSNGFSKKNHAPLVTVILVLGMLFRSRSFHALGLSVNSNRRSWKKWLGGRDVPSISTIARGLRKLDTEALRRISAAINHKLRRNKALATSALSHGLMVAAVDGHETISSKKRCCRECKRRTKEINGRKVVEFYHQYVMCQLVLGAIPFVIDMEPVRRSEGELTAAKRLLKRVLREQRWMADVFVFDALYLDSGLLNMLDGANKFWVVVLKQEKRECYAEIDRLLPGIKSREWDHGKKHVRLWDVPGLVGWDKLDKSFRAVVCDEKELVYRRDKNGRKQIREENSHWRWLTNMPEIYPARFIYDFGHGRWDIENRGFNELVNQCHFDHAFHHHPNALLAMLWIIVIAFILSYAFFLRNLKPQFRKTISTRQNLSEQLKLSVADTSTIILISFSP